MRTAKQIVGQTNELARLFYRQWGYEVDEGFRFDESIHGHEIIAWQQACIAQELLTDTCVDDALSELEED